MKTYSGELNIDTPCRDAVVSYEGMNLGYNYYTIEESINPHRIPEQVYHDNEWQHYKPKPKKVWGIAEAGEDYWSIHFYNGKFSVQPFCNTGLEPIKNVWLSKEHAEQHAKALNMANEFRLLSDVPVDGVEQRVIDDEGDVVRSVYNIYKFRGAIFGVVFNTREQAEQALAKFPQIHIANKIIQFGFHGIVEERI